MRTPERKTLKIVLWSATLIAYAVGLGPFAIAAGPGGSNAEVVDFSQCANGAAPSTSTACPGGWINGILHEPNSHYGEGEVVPQRLVLEIPEGSDATGRSVTLSYQARKGTVHAYDSLATWDNSQTTAGRCDGLAASECPAAPLSTAGIPDDGTAVPPATVGGAVTTPHMLSGAARLMTMYGGTITDVSAPVHDNAGGAGDDFATLTVTFDVPATTEARTVMLLFGGHLAAALGANGWGPGLGSSSISGGPYHVRVTAVDGASVGRRDNQIQGATLFHPTVTTVPVPDGGPVGVTIHDTAQLLGGSGSPSGTVTFTLYPPDDPTCAGAPVFTSTVPVSGSTAVSGTYTTAEVGTYHWIASYSGGESDAAATSECGEPVTTTRAAPGITTVPVPSATTVGSSIHDTATITGGFSPSGTVTFDLYGPDDPACEGQPIWSDDAAVSGGKATSDSVPATETGTYQWIAHYDGDDNNSAADGECGDEPVTVSKADPDIATVPVPSTAKVGDPIHDTATVSDGYNPSGTVTFELFGPADPTCAGEPIFTSTVPLGTDGTATSESYTTTGAGTHRWVATYNGDDDNDVAISGCDEELVTVQLVLSNVVTNPNTNPKTTTGTNTGTNGEALSGTQTGTLPRTGVDMLPTTTAGLVLLVLGAIMSWTPLRRRQRAREI